MRKIKKKKLEKCSFIFGIEFYSIEDGRLSYLYVKKVRGFVVEFLGRVPYR